MWWRSAANCSFFLPLLLAVRVPAPVTRSPGLRPPGFRRLRIPLGVSRPSLRRLRRGSLRLVRSASQLLWRKSDSPRPCIIRLRLPRLPDADRTGDAPAVGRRTADRARSVPAHASVYDHAAVSALAISRPSVLPSVGEQRRRPGKRVASRLNGWPVRSPVNARRCPRGQLRMTRGRCGSLLLHRDGLAPSTPCRSPGALRFTPQQPT